MRQRLISAAVLVPVVVVLFVLGAPWLTLGIALLAALGAFECAKLVRAAGLGSSLWLPVVWAPLFVIGFAWVVGPNAPPGGWVLIAPAFAVLIVLAAADGFRQKDPATGFRRWIGTVFAGSYPALIGFAAAFVGLLPARPDALFLGYVVDGGRIWLLVLVATVWTLDSVAFVVGRIYGRGRFMNHISPKKTWTGAIGGTVAAVLVCTLLFSTGGMSQVGGLLIGVVIAVAAQVGDLAESMLKRAANAKDSGDLIPGHGGFLDRIDSFLFAAPAMYTCLGVLGVMTAMRLM